MKIIGLAASPRRAGNSETLLDEFLRGAQEAGADTEKFALAELNIRPCDGCDICSSRGYCPHSDDAMKLLPRLAEADVVALATPVYFYAVPAQAKALIDRAQYLWARKNVLHRKVGKSGGRGVLIAVGGSRGKKLFDGISLTVRYFMDTLGKKLAASMFVREMDEIDAARRDARALSQARRLGAKIAAGRNRPAKRR